MCSFVSEMYIVDKRVRLFYFYKPGCHVLSSSKKKNYVNLVIIIFWPKYSILPYGIDFYPNQPSQIHYFNPKNSIDIYIYMCIIYIYVLIYVYSHSTKDHILQIKSDSAIKVKVIDMAAVSSLSLCYTQQTHLTTPLVFGVGGGALSGSPFRVDAIRTPFCLCT